MISLGGVSIVLMYMYNMVYIGCCIDDIQWWVILIRNGSTDDRVAHLTFSIQARISSGFFFKEIDQPDILLQNQVVLFWHTYCVCFSSNKTRRNTISVNPYNSTVYLLSDESLKCLGNKYIYLIYDLLQSHHCTLNRS